MITKIEYWRGQDSNLRRRLPTDLQSAPFGRSGTSPYCGWSWLWDSNPQPAAYKAAALPIELSQLLCVLLIFKNFLCQIN